MPLSSILIIIGMVVLVITVFGLNFYFMGKKGPTLEEKEKAAAAFGDADTMKLYNSDFAPYRRQFADRKILALGYALHITTQKEEYKNMGKDMLRTTLTLGMVKFRTVEVATPLVLADDGLHLLELDTHDNVKEHLLFNKERLANATLKKFDEPLAGKQTLCDEERVYTLSIPTDSDTFNIHLYTASYPTAEKFQSTLPAQRLRFFAAGRYFLKMLAEQYPNLAV